MSESPKAYIPDAPPRQPLPLLQLILVGLQHVLLMYGGAIAVPLIIGQAAGLSREEIAFLINADLLVAGVATIVQSLGIGPVGIRMPVMMGASFAAVGSMVAMAGMPGVGLQGSSARPSPPVSSAC
jgi:NCS2 family nucleobase:cation symporter-2